MNEDNTPPISMPPQEPKTFTIKGQSTPPKKSKKKALLIILLLAIILATAVGVWTLMKGDKQPAATPPTSTDTGIKPVENTLVPYAVAYAYGDPEKAPREFFWRPLSGGERTTAGKIGSKNYLSYSDVYKDKVLVVSTAGTDNKSGETVWYSKDSGKTYTKIFTGEPSDGQGLAAQITSAAFSTDGSAIVIGFLPTDGNNTVKEINPDTKAVTDLFNIEQRGVFIEEYDKTAKKLYYFTGCYNCDGSHSNKLLLRDIETKTESTVYEDTAKVGVETVFNSDLSKVLKVSGIIGMGIGPGKPFTVEEFDIASKKSKKLVTINEDMIPKVGYSDGDSTPYYTQKASVYTVENGKKTLLFEAAESIRDVYLVDQDQVVASAGTSEDYILTGYNVTTKKVTNILNGDANTNIFGVTWK